MFEKDFKNWHDKKESLHKEKERPFFKEGEVWFCSLGANIGFEQDGHGNDFLRPVVVMKKFNNEVLWGIPLTKSHKKSKHYFSFQFNNEKSTVILSQLRLIDAKRLQYKVGTIAPEHLLEIKKRLTQFLA